MNLKNVFWGYDCIIQSFPTHNYAFICVIMSFISAGGDLTPNGIELVGDDLTCVDFARRRLRGRRFDPDSMWLTMWPFTWPTEANENSRVARGTLSAITVGSSNLSVCSGPKFRAAAPNIVADQYFSVVLDLISDKTSSYQTETGPCLSWCTPGGVPHETKTQTVTRWRPSSNVRALVNTGSRLLRGAYREKWRRQNGVASAPDRSANYTKICS